MGGNAAGGGVHVRQKALVAAHQAAFDEGLGKAHQPAPTPISHSAALIVKNEHSVAANTAAAQIPSRP